MPKRATSLCYTAIAAIVAASLSPMMLSVAQANQGAKRTHTAATHGARLHHRQYRESRIGPKIYGAAPSSDGCTWPYRNQFPPCQSTFPQGDPNYHGPRAGVTFDQPW